MPKNEPVLQYAPNSVERAELNSALGNLISHKIEVPVIINGKERFTGKTSDIRAPHSLETKLGIFHSARSEDIRDAIDGALEAWKFWSAQSLEVRSRVFLRAADLLRKKYRQILNSSTMLGQSKTCYQAEIDSACELIDFFEFNVHFARELEGIQPLSIPGIRNALEYRPLEGFVFAVTPFNFTSIAGNLPTAPALLGNTAVWKPASTSVLSSFFIYKLLEESGLPPGVIQFLPGSGAEIGNQVLAHSDLAGIHFTGSTSTFQNLWRTVGQNITNYKNYPRLIGETGGKDFVIVHPSANKDAVVANLIRGAFEYQGQKCSAASRAYIARSVWQKMKTELVEETQNISMGDISDYRNFMGAVIDRASLKNIGQYLDRAKLASDASIIAGGGYREMPGYFIEPTIIETTNPKYETMETELFGPVLTLYVYEDSKYSEILSLCDRTSPYALTGSIFATDPAAVEEAKAKLRYSAGNFYINVKPTGAVVGQQPFGGARASGTNDKAGSILNLVRWTSPRTLSETLNSPVDYRYPYMND